MWKWEYKRKWEHFFFIFGLEKRRGMTIFFLTFFLNIHIYSLLNENRIFFILVCCVCLVICSLGYFFQMLSTISLTRGGFSIPRKILLYRIEKRVACVVMDTSCKMAIICFVLNFYMLKTYNIFVLTQDFYFIKTIYTFSRNLTTRRKIYF